MVALGDDFDWVFSANEVTFERSARHVTTRNEVLFVELAGSEVEGREMFRKHQEHTATIRKHLTQKLLAHLDTISIERNVQDHFTGGLFDYRAKPVYLRDEPARNELDNPEGEPVADNAVLHTYKGRRFLSLSRKYYDGLTREPRLLRAGMGPTPPTFELRKSNRLPDALVMHLPELQVAVARFHGDETVDVERIRDEAAVRYVADHPEKVADFLGLTAEDLQQIPHDNPQGE